MNNIQIYLMLSINLRYSFSGSSAAREKKSTSKIIIH